MRIRINWHRNSPTRTTSFLRWSRNLSLGVGVLFLGYYGYVLLDARLFETCQNRRFQQALKSSTPLNSGSGNLHVSPLPSAPAESNRVRNESPDLAGRAGSVLGRIEISAIGVEAMIVEGIDAKTLRRGVGHFPGTPLPGQQGNVAIAGHRDTFFRALRNIREDHEITLETLNGTWRYRVDSTQVVDPGDVYVLDNSTEAILTLVTCYPFNFVGPAPRRFIVRAHRLSAETLEPRMHADKDGRRD